MQEHPLVPPVGSLLDLRGCRVLVTGAAGNIGQGIARRLAAAGAAVIAHGRSADGVLKALADDIGSRGGSCQVAAADLLEPAAVDRMLDSLAEDGLYAVVNNAALQPSRAFADISRAEWRAMMATNLDAAFQLTQRAAALMTAREVRGAVVNVSSIEGQDPAVDHGHYATSKAALGMLTKAAALELGPRGIRVNAVSPGLIDHDGLAADWPDGVGRWRARAPLGRLGRAEDVADAVLFLLSPAARWISGANLVVDGGMSTVSRW